MPVSVLLLTDCHKKFLLKCVSASFLEVRQMKMLYHRQLKMKVHVAQSVSFFYQKPALIVNIVQAHMQNLSKQTLKETLNCRKL